jgi:uncharacterized protein (TIGR03067 family)
MRHVFATLMLSFAPVTILYATDTNSELAPFQGNWEVTELVEDGKVIPKEAIRKWLPSGGRARIAENAILFTSSHDGKQHAKVFSIDATRFPKGIDISSREAQVSQGIYRFDDDRLIVCLSDLTVAARPDEFSAPQGSGRMLMVLSRVEKKPSPESRPRAQPQSKTAAKVLTDDQVKQMLVGTWQMNDGLGIIYATVNANGTFHTTRDVQEIRVFQTVFLRTPVSSGTWNVSNGQLTYRIGASTHPERAGLTVTLFVRSISAKDLIFVDALGRVGTGVKVR